MAKIEHQKQVKVRKYNELKKNLQVLDYMEMEQSKDRLILNSKQKDEEQKSNSVGQSNATTAACSNQFSAYFKKCKDEQVSNLYELARNKDPAIDIQMKPVRNRTPTANFECHRLPFPDLYKLSDDEQEVSQEGNQMIGSDSDENRFTDAGLETVQPRVIQKQDSTSPFRK